MNYWVLSLNERITNHGLWSNLCLWYIYLMGAIKKCWGTIESGFLTVFCAEISIKKHCELLKWVLHHGGCYTLREL